MLVQEQGVSASQMGRKARSASDRCRTSTDLYAIPASWTGCSPSVTAIFERHHSRSVFLTGRMELPVVKHMGSNGQTPGLARTNQ
jgi:hypothetical protein